MTARTAAALARVTPYVCLGFNTGVVLVDMILGQYTSAAYQLIAVALLVGWVSLIPKVDAWLDAQLGTAIANRKTAELALSVMETHARAGDLQVRLSGADHHERRH